MTLESRCESTPDRPPERTRGLDACRPESLGTARWRLHELAQKWLTGVLASARGGLQDDWAVDLGGRLHDGVDLFHVFTLKAGSPY